MQLLSANLLTVYSFPQVQPRINKLPGPTPPTPKNSNPSTADYQNDHPYNLPVIFIASRPHDQSQAVIQQLSKHAIVDEHVRENPAFAHMNELHAHLKP